MKQIGIIGLGKMGLGIALNLIDHKFDVRAFNRHVEPLGEIEKAGGKKASSPEELVSALGHPRIVWFMLTAGPALDDILFKDGLIYQMEKGDIVIDGGNSNFKDSVRRYHLCKDKGIYFLDAGVSGGPAGARNGAAIMVGGDREAFEKAEHVFKALSVDNGYAYMGHEGTGHYVKMVHNAIEYGMLQAIGEGYELLKSGPYKNLDLKVITGVYQNGTVIRGFLIDLMKRVFAKNPDLKDVLGYVQDSGEGKWAVETALEHSVPFVLNTYALMFRHITRQDQSFAAKVIASLRQEFGGHEVKTK